MSWRPSDPQTPRARRTPATPRIGGTGVPVPCWSCYRPLSPAELAGLDRAAAHYCARCRTTGAAGRHAARQSELPA